MSASALKIVLLLSVVVAALAAVDAVRGEHWDQFFLLVVLVAFQALAWSLARTFDTAVRLRRDLRSWVVDHAALTDDTPDAVVDRAMAAYRAEFLPHSES